MGASKEYFLIMQEEHFNTLTEEQRALYTHIEVRESNEYENNKDDPNYIKLHKAERKAKKDKQQYLFEKRQKK